MALFLLNNTMRNLFLPIVGGREITQRLHIKSPTPLIKGEVALLPVNKGPVLLRRESKKVVPVRRAWMESLKYFIPRVVTLAVS